MAFPVTKPRGSVLRRLANRSVAVELAAAVALLVAVQIYVNLFSRVSDRLEDVLVATSLEEPHTVLTAIDGVLVLGGIAVIGVAYGSRRGVSVPTALPDRADGRLVGVAVLGAALIGLVPNLVGVAFLGVPTEHLATSILEVDQILFDRTGIWMAWFTAGMVLLYHAFVQTAFRRVLDGDRAVALTTLLGAYAVIPEFPGGSSLFLVSGPWLHFTAERTAVAALVLLALGVAVYADERVEDDRVRRFALVPLVAAGGVALLAIGTAFEGPLELLPVVGKIGVVGVAAYAYDGTESLVAPAAVYAAFALVVSVVSRAYLLAFLSA